MSILSMSLSIPTPPQSLSSAKTLFLSPISISLTTKFTHLSLVTTPYKTTPIRMGGGPRTFPGGVSKWQWKRMQAKKAKQLLKARLTRERQIYEMRKRAELKAAVSELERPWETVEKPPNLFSVGADEQLKVLADRFQKPGGLDLWSERDGPEIFRPDNGLPSSRFFPKGVVHSVKPYGKIAELSSRSEELEGLSSEEGLSPGPVSERDGHPDMIRKEKSKSFDFDKRANVSDFRSRKLDGVVEEGESRMKGNRRKYMSDSKEIHFTDERNNRQDDSAGKFRKNKGYENGEKSNSKVFNMNLQNDGKYRFELEN